MNSGQIESVQAFEQEAGTVSSAKTAEEAMSRVIGPRQNQEARNKGNPGALEGARSSSRSTVGKNQRLGKLGEDMACIYLEDINFTILERNWTCCYGEADIIATEGDVLVFLEVKTRSEAYDGLPEYAVTAEKRIRYEKIAIAYLTGNRRPSGRVRFDVIAIKMTGKQRCMLRHHRDVFGSGE